MTKGRGQKGARKICPRLEHNSLPEQGGGCFVLSCKQVCHTEKVEESRTCSWVKTHGLLDFGYRFQRVSGVDPIVATKVTSQNKIGIQRQRNVDFRLCPVEVPFERSGHRQDASC